MLRRLAQFVLGLAICLIIAAPVGAVPNIF